MSGNKTKGSDNVSFVYSVAHNYYKKFYLRTEFVHFHHKNCQLKKKQNKIW